MRKRSAETHPSNTKKMHALQSPHANHDNEAEDEEEATPRQYQLEIFKRATQENTIAYLDTGAGKTMIATMLLRAFVHQIRKSQKNYAVFLVPTVVLVHQQTQVLKIHTDLKVGEYWGAMGVDLWDKKRWEQELQLYEVFVMTPQIFLDNLRHSFFNFDGLRVLIFDECHHARKNHPYSCIMHEFYHRKKRQGMTEYPRIFGMTASPVYSKGKGFTECITEISSLETTLDAKVYTLKDITVLEAFISYPDVKILCYESKIVPYDVVKDLVAKLYYLQEKHMQFIENLVMDESSADSAKRKIRKLYSMLHFCIEEMGIWAAAIACEFHRRTKANKFGLNFGEKNIIVTNAVKHFLQDSLSTCQQALPSEMTWHSGDDIEKAVKAGFLSLKVRRLVDSLQAFRDWKKQRCIIFVERKITSVVISKILQSMDHFTHLTIEYMVGNTATIQDKSQRDQKKIIEDFRNGKVNIIVATQVLEEGLDIQGCNIVVRYDLPKTICSFIQSRGRARMKDSHYLLLVRDGEQLAQVNRLLGGEKQMREAALQNGRVKSVSKSVLLDPESYYTVEKTGAVVTSNSSVALLYHYCSQLPCDRYYKSQPIFQIDKEGGQCLLKLPTNCPIPRVIVHECGIPLKKLACLEACKQLHAIGALNDNLLPDVIHEDINDYEDREKEKGAKNQKESYPLYIPNSFVGNWSILSKQTLFYGYRLSFQQGVSSDVRFRDALLLVKEALGSDLTKTEINLNSPKGVVRLQIQFTGALELSSHEVELAVLFQVKIFRLLISRTVDSSEQTNLDGSDLLNKTIMYLILPLVEDGSNRVDWECINKVGCDKVSNNDCIQNSEHLLNTKSGDISAELLVDTVVETPHNKILYYVRNILRDLNASSHMLSGNLSHGSLTYSDYFHKKHQIEIFFKEQPLLSAKRLFKVKNYLLQYQEKKKVPDNSFNVELPPELCRIVCFGVPESVLYSFSFLPSVMHRIESLLRASQLKSRISNSVKVDISTVKVLEALTRKKCLESMSLETFETLGDSFLKYVVSQHVFANYSLKDAGQLSMERKLAISNNALWKIGCACLIPGFIHNEPFEATRWIIPGQHILLDSEDLHDISESLEGMYIKGRNLLSKKEVADVVEALIGVYLVECGEFVTLEFIRWLGIDAEISMWIPKTPLNQEYLDIVNVSDLESLLGYSFQSAAILVEALTHASYQCNNLHACYQRLEFLGDAVLDYCLTLHFYISYPGLSPGKLTDLRSAAVNNHCYALASVKHSLQQHLLHLSDTLHSDITDFVKSVGANVKSSMHSYGWRNENIGLPKVLADIFESVAGAILVDSGFQTVTVWAAMKPLLEPLVTPETLPYHPVRELQELCSKWSCQLSFQPAEWRDGKCYVKVEVQNGDKLYVESSEGPNKKTSKRDASEKMLMILKG